MCVFRPALYFRGYLPQQGQRCLRKLAETPISVCDPAAACSFTARACALTFFFSVRAVAVEAMREELQGLKLLSTVTDAAVGTGALENASVDSPARFLPTMCSALNTSLLANLPADVNRALHDPSAGEASKEAEVQSSLGALLQHLTTMLQAPLFFHDTHASGLTNPLGRIDVTFCASGVLSWTNVVTFFEFKKTLHDGHLYNEAVGQVVNRCKDIFSKQSERAHVVAAVMDAHRIDVIKISSARCGRGPSLVHTELLPFELDIENCGFQLLVRLLTAPAAQLGFKPASMPAPFQVLLEGPRNQSAALSKIESLVVNEHAHAAVYTACIDDSSSTRVVVKMSEHAEAEATWLRLLQRCEYVPKLVATGQDAAGLHCLVIRPLGRSLPLGEVENACLVYTCLADVCEALAAARDAGLLHRDVSFNNIVEFQGRGILLDWHVAARVGGRATAGFSGTRMFCGRYLHLSKRSRPHMKDHVHTLKDDLESVVYVLLYIAMEGKLPWRKLRSHDDLWSLKSYFVHAPKEHLSNSCFDAVLLDLVAQVNKGPTAEGFIATLRAAAAGTVSRVSDPGRS
jgi:hypothetical protein